MSLRKLPPTGCNSLALTANQHLPWPPPISQLSTTKYFDEPFLSTTSSLTIRIQSASFTGNRTSSSWHAENDLAFNDSNKYITGLSELFRWKLIWKAGKIVKVEQPAPVVLNPSSVLPMFELTNFISMDNFPKAMPIHPMSEKEAAMPIRAQVFNKSALIDSKKKESTAALSPSVPVEVDKHPQEVEEEEDAEGKVDDFFTKALQPSATFSSVHHKRGPVFAEFIHSSPDENEEEDADQCPTKKSKPCTNNFSMQILFFKEEDAQGLWNREIGTFLNLYIVTAISCPLWA
ncbi:hypothetical protein GYMLUDRAFT_65501 [Collybiopsis luxurians FD-317 M1]|uniref:Uncharacterized protein n=1 Tax=Collybiopsis luxurians FD-317 M1 TaxID=944289 RepID=A0A0D0C527_9AGAR|nr:hypothetical protein GYMLUDRAFT_65501 [Collybiopsis luxurians FD-317 M1]